MAKSEKQKVVTPVKKEVAPTPVIENKEPETKDDFFPEEVHIKEVSIKRDVKREEAIKILIEQHKKQKL